MPKVPKGIPREHPNAASSHMGDRCVAATSLRCCGGTPGDQDDRGTNELSKIESILGTRMSQNLSQDRRLACEHPWHATAMASRRQGLSAILWHYMTKCRPGKPKIKELLAVLGKFGVEADKYGLTRIQVAPATTARVVTWRRLATGRATWLCTRFPFHVDDDLPLGHIHLHIGDSPRCLNTQYPGV